MPTCSGSLRRPREVLRRYPPCPGLTTLRAAFYSIRTWWPHKAVNCTAKVVGLAARQMPASLARARCFGHSRVASRPPDETTTRLCGRGGQIRRVRRTRLHLPRNHRRGLDPDLAPPSRLVIYGTRSNHGPFGTFLPNEPWFVPSCRATRIVRRTSALPSPAMPALPLLPRPCQAGRPAPLPSRPSETTPEEAAMTATMKARCPGRARAGHEPASALPARP
jgi:hypothetical protein